MLWAGFLGARSSTRDHDDHHDHDHDDQRAEYEDNRATAAGAPPSGGCGPAVVGTLGGLGGLGWLGPGGAAVLGPLRPGQTEEALRGPARGRAGVLGGLRLGQAGVLGGVGVGQAGVLGSLEAGRAEEALGGPVGSRGRGRGRCGLPRDRSLSRGLARGNVGQRLAGDRSELTREQPCPRALDGRARQTFASLVVELVGQLSQQVVDDQRPTLRRYAGARSECVERRERAVADRGAVDRKQARDLVVVASALKHELENGALVAGKAVKRGHSRVAYSSH